MVMVGFKWSVVRWGWVLIVMGGFGWADRW